MRVRALLITASAAAVLAGVAVPAADAARVSATDGSVSVVADDADGANDLRISRSGSVVTVVEANPAAVLVTSSGRCTASGQTVTCTQSRPATFLDVNTGLGDDRVTVGGTLGDASQVLLGAGDDVWTGGGDDDVADGGAGDDSLSGGGGDDVLRGGSGADVLSGGADDDLLVEGAGADRLDGGAGDDAFSLGVAADADTYVAGPGKDELTIARPEGASVRVSPDGVADDGAPGEGDDIREPFEVVLSTGGSADVVIGGDVGASYELGAGDDTLTAGAGADTILPGEGDDVVDAGGGDDLVSEWRDPADDQWDTDDYDVLRGGAGDDEIYGALGDDTLEGGPGVDLLDGDEGDDLIRSADGVADSVVCGADDDRLERDALDVADADCEQVSIVAAPATPSGDPSDPAGSEASPDASEVLGFSATGSGGGGSSTKSSGGPAASRGVAAKRIGRRKLRVTLTSPVAGTATLRLLRAGRKVATTRVRVRAAGPVKAILMSSRRIRSGKYTLVMTVRRAGGARPITRRVTFKL